MVLNTKVCDDAFKDSSGNNLQLSFPSSMPVGTNIIAAANPVPVAKILHGNSVITERDASLGGGMRISKLEFTDAIYDGDQTLGTPAVAYKAFVATLNVEASKAAGSYGKQNPKQTFSSRILLRANASNSAGTIEKCAGRANVWIVPTYSSFSGTIYVDNPMGVTPHTVVSGLYSVTTPKKVSFAISEKSPAEQCQEAGFSGFASPCLAYAGYGPAGSNVQGSIVSNNLTTDSGGNRYWAYACIFGDGGVTGILFSAPTRIMCIP